MPYCGRVAIFIVKCYADGLGDCLHYNVSNSRQFQLELSYAFETRPIYCSFRSSEVLETRCWKLVGPCYLHGGIAQIIHLLGYGGAACFFRLAIFWKGFATREVEDCQELSFRAF